jgi:hypothetical protein
MELVVGIIVVALLIVIMAFLYNPTLKHRHQLGHAMAGFAGRAWSFVDTLSMFWNIKIVSVEKKTVNDKPYEAVLFGLNNPSYGIDNWKIAVMYNVSTGKYEEFCGLDNATHDAVKALGAKMACGEAKNIADTITVAAGSV